MIKWNGKEETAAPYGTVIQKRARQESGASLPLEARTDAAARLGHARSAAATSAAAAASRSLVGVGAVHPRLFVAADALSSRPPRLTLTHGGCAKGMSVLHNTSKNKCFGF